MDKRVLLAVITLIVACILIQNANAKLFGVYHPQRYYNYRPRHQQHWQYPTASQFAWNEDLDDETARRPSYLVDSDTAVNEVYSRRPAYFIGSDRDDGFGKKRKYALESEAGKNLFSGLYYHPY